MSDTTRMITVPADDFYELQATALEPMTLSNRAAGVVHTTLVLGAVAGAWTAAAWGWAKATDWLEERQLQRQMTVLNKDHNRK